MRSRVFTGIVISAVVMIAVPFAHAGDNPTARPFHGTFEGFASWYGTDICPLSGFPPTETNAVGEMSHLGRTTLYNRHCTTADGTQTIGGQGFLVAANGDQLDVVYTATQSVFDGSLIVMEGTYIITGGTGRFEGASGTFAATVYVTFEGFDDFEWPLEMVFVGTIVY